MPLDWKPGDKVIVGAPKTLKPWLKEEKQPRNGRLVPGKKSLA